MNIEKMKELRARLVKAVAQKIEAMADMEKAESMRMKAEADYGAAVEAIHGIKNVIITHMMEEQA
jgi:hypothetical protein